MFCMNCGAKLPDGAKFCRNCGCKLGTVATDNVVQEPIEQKENKPVKPEVNKPFFFGKYRGKPIEWIVFIVTDGFPGTGENVAFLLSKNAITEKAYDECNKQAVWKNCTLRKWLNEDFFESAFTDEEQEKIIGTDGLSGVYDHITLMIGNLLQAGMMKEKEIRICLNANGQRCCWWINMAIENEVAGTFCDLKGKILLDFDGLEFLEHLKDYDANVTKKMGVRPMLIYRM